LENSLHVDKRDTLQVVNFKRGIVSALQFQVLDAAEYKDPLQEV